MTKTIFCLFVLNTNGDPNCIFYEGISRRGVPTWRFLDEPYGPNEMEERMLNLQHFFSNVSPESPAVMGLTAMVGVRV